MILNLFKEFMMKRGLALGLILSCIMVFGCEEEASSQGIKIKEHEFVLGRDTYHQNLTLFLQDWGLTANGVNANSEIVNNIYSARERAYINLQYLDGDNRIRVIEFHYDLNNVLQGFKMFEFDGSPQGAVFGAIADRGLPLGSNKISIPGPKKEDRKQTRYVSGIETQNIKRGGYVFQYCWTSDMSGLSYLAIYKSAN
jgi:hypothetical protein